MGCTPQGFPSKRATLYRKALDILLEEWAAEKRIQPGEIYQGLNADLEKVLLAEIAYQGFIHDQLFFTQQELIAQIKAFLSDTVDKPKYLDGRAVLEAIAVQQGILVERAEEIFSFSHLTLQEYLTAQHISQDHHLIKQLVTEKLCNQRWQEVFLLVSGLLGRADEILMLMETRIQHYINAPKLQALIAWADRLTAGSEGDFKPVVKRVSALHWSLDLTRALDLTYTSTLYSAHARALNLVHALDPSLDLTRAHALDLEISLSFSHNLLREIQETKIFSHVNLKRLLAKLEVLKVKASDNKRSVESRQNFSERVYQTWIEALDFQREWLDLSEAEAEALVSYLYAAELMVRCKEAAVRVSREKWEAIEARMLTVQGERA